MVRRDTRAVGDAAEELVFRYLRECGLRPVSRNFRCRGGEIDLIMLDDDCLVFVEVRYRSGRSLVPAALTVDRRKQRRLVRAAEMFLATRRGFERRSTRFDVVGVDRDRDGRRSIEWLQGAFAA